MERPSFAPIVTIGLVAAAVVVAATSASPEAFARCAPGYGRSFALLGRTTAIPGGAFVVTIRARSSRAEDQGDQLPAQLTLHAAECVGSGCLVRAAVTELAANLFRVAVPAGLAPGEYRVDEIGPDARVTIARGTAAPAIVDRPRIRAVGPWRGPRASGNTVELEAPPPAGAIGIIARWSGTSLFAPTGHVPQAFTLLAPRCWRDGPAVPPLRAGEIVEVAFVDAAGRASPTATAAATASQP